MTVEPRSRREKWGGTKKRLLALYGHRSNQAPNLFTQNNRRYSIFRSQVVMVEKSVIQQELLLNKV